MRSLVLLFAFAGLIMAANRTDKMEAAIHSGEFQKITSIAVAQHGKILYERYFDGDAQTLRNTRSATKTVTGMLVGIAIQKGFIPAVTAPVLPYFNDHQPFKNPDPLKAKMTIEDLLTMNSSLDCNDWVDGSPGNEERMYPTKDWVRFVFDLPVRPTRGFSYCTGGVAMLGEILQRSTKTPVPQFAQENLFDGLGIRNEKWSFSPTGVAMTGGGLELATRDLLKLAELYLQNGRWNGKQIVPQSWVEASIRAHLPIDDRTEYGYLWWLTNFKSEGKSYPAFFMTGNGGNKVVAIPGSDLVVVITSTNYNTRGMHQQTERLLTEFILPEFAQ
jgi:CubicO group peptidase (beta-lactamase class C family)